MIYCHYDEFITIDPVQCNQHLLQSQQHSKKYEDPKQEELNFCQINVFNFYTFHLIHSGFAIFDLLLSQKNTILHSIENCNLLYDVSFCHMYHNFLAYISFEGYMNYLMRNYKVNLY